MFIRENAIEVIEKLKNSKSETWVSIPDFNDKYFVNTKGEVYNTALDRLLKLVNVKYGNQLHKNLVISMVQNGNTLIELLNILFCREKVQI